MIILIILLILFFIGISLMRTDRVDGGFWGFILMLLAGIYLILHILFWSMSTYNYNVFYVKRQAFVETLENSRKSGNQIEQAAILHDISEWNQELAERKYNRSVFLLRDYVDKRTELLQPIK